MKQSSVPMIYQANPLIESRKPLNVIEMRLFLLAIEDVNPHISEKDKYYDKEFRELHLTPAEVKEIFGDGKYLSRLESICMGMAEKVVTKRKKEDNSFEIYPIFSYIKYKPKEGLYIRLNSEMRPFLLDLYTSKTGYTKFSMKQLFNLSSAYAMRLLELMLQYKGMMKNKIIVRYFSLNDLRFLLDIEPDKYKRMCDFRNVVLDKPIKEIAQKTLYKLTYQVEKKGRKVVGFTFAMDCRHVLPDDMVQETITLEAAPKKKDWHGLSAKVINKLTMICGSNEEFKKRMDYAVSLLEKRKPEKPEAFLYKAVAENYLQQELDRQEEVQKKAREKKEWDDFLGNLDGEAKHVLERMITIGKIAPLIAKSLLERFGAERCRRNFEAQRVNPMVKNLAGAAVMAIQQDWQGQIDAFTTETEQQAEQKEQDAVDERGRQIVYIGGKKYYVEPDPVVEKIDEEKLDPALREFLDHRLGRDKETV